MTTWHDVCDAEQVAEDLPLSANLAGKEIGVYVLGGQYYALEDICPHAYALLSQGFVDGEEIECPLHGAKFHIPTGRCTKEPADRDLKTLQAKLDGGRVLVAVDE